MLRQTSLSHIKIERTWQSEQGVGRGVRGGMLLKTKKGDVEDMKGLSSRSLKSSAPQCEPQSLWAAAKHDIALARLGASNNASKVSLVPRH